MNSPIINAQLHEKITFRGPFSFASKPFSLSYSKDYGYLYNSDGSISGVTSSGDDCIPPEGYDICTSQGDISL